MALTIVKRPLGFLTDGLPREVATTSTASALVHTAQSSSLITEELWVFASMDQTQTVGQTLNFIINSNSFSIEIPVRAVEHPVLQGFFLMGNTSASSGNKVEFFGSSTAGMFLHGYVNRITETTAI